MTGDELVEIDADGDAFGTRQPSDHHLATILSAVNDREIFLSHEMDFILDVRILADPALE